MIKISDRHIHCVYCVVDDLTLTDGYCLLKQKELKWVFHECCKDAVLRPIEILMYFLKHEHYCEDWGSATQTAMEYLDKVGFNKYPFQKEVEK